MDSWIQKYPAIPYVVPFALFIFLTGIIPYFPKTLLWGYPLKTLLVGISILILLKYYPILGKAHLAWAIFIGLLVFGIWIHPQHYYPWLGQPIIFNPWVEISLDFAWIWIGIRILGAVVVVPVIEELFWRGFVLRWLIAADFEKIPLGTFTWSSFIWTCILFGVEHHLWLVGMIAGIAYNLLLYRTKSLKACIIAHSLTNLCLGVYVLYQGAWEFW